MFGQSRSSSNPESGQTLIEILVVLAILGFTALAFLSGLNTTSVITLSTDLKETAKNLAESQMEYVKNQDFAASYVPSSTLASEYTGYSTNITVGTVPERDGNIQKITVTVWHQGKELTSLEGYKVN